MKVKEPKKAEIYLEYQPYTDYPPQKRANLYGQACSNDSVTIESWREKWIKQIQLNHEKYGPFNDRSIGQLFNEFRHLPVIVAGSGPSLAENGHKLKDKGDIPLVSCLHNFHFFEDRDIDVDYYVSLDAGPVTVEEVSEGGKHDSGWYWEQTETKTLLCYIGTHPELLEKWRGNVYFFNCPIPDKKVWEACDELEPFGAYVSTGGNVLGAATYIAKAIFGANPVIYVGANFSFGYDQRFHGWDSKYDKNMGHCVRVTDVYGNKVKTWQSYLNFKAWFEWVAESIPGIYINCTEGGCMGSYNEGNISSIRQIDLDECLKMYNLNEAIRDSMESPEKNLKKLLF